MLLCTYVYTYVGGWWEGGEWIRYHVIKGISKTNRLLFAHQFSQHWLTTNCVTTDKKWNNRFEERKKEADLTFIIQVTNYGTGTPG